MRGATPLFSSGSENWCTPPDLLQAVVDGDLGGYQFDCDFAASVRSAVCQRFFAPDHPFPEFRDTLADPLPPSLPLRGTGWLNPPFSRGDKAQNKPAFPIEPWLIRARYLAGLAPVTPYSWTMYVLVPARIDTSWWWEWIWPYAAEIRLIPGRLRFIDPATGTPRAGAPFPSALLVYRPGHAGVPLVRKWAFR